MRRDVSLSGIIPNLYLSDHRDPSDVDVQQTITGDFTSNSISVSAPWNPLVGLVARAYVDDQVLCRQAPTPSVKKSERLGDFGLE